MSQLSRILVAIQRIRNQIKKSVPWILLLEVFSEWSPKSHKLATARRSIGAVVFGFFVLWRWRPSQVSDEIAWYVASLFGIAFAALLIDYLGRVVAHYGAFTKRQGYFIVPIATLLLPTVYCLGMTDPSLDRSSQKLEKAKIAALTREIDALHEQLKPCVSVDLELNPDKSKRILVDDDGVHIPLKFALRNSGKTIARNVQAICEPFFMSEFPVYPDPDCAEMALIDLAPGERISVAFVVSSLTEEIPETDWKLSFMEVGFTYYGEGESRRMYRSSLVFSSDENHNFLIIERELCSRVVPDPGIPRAGRIRTRVKPPPKRD